MAGPYRLCEGRGPPMAELDPNSTVAVRPLNGAQCATSAPGPIAACREHQSTRFRLLSVPRPALIPYSQDSDNIEFTNLVVYSSSADQPCFENVDCASYVPSRCAALRFRDVIRGWRA